MSASTVRALRQADHRIVRADELGLKGASDASLLERAVRAGQLFLTEDQDFAHLFRYPLASHHGIILLRIATSLKRPALHAMLIRLLDTHTASMLDHALAIVSPEKFEIRRLDE